MSRLSGPQRAERRREQAKKRKETAKARVVRKGQRATLNGKRVIADGKGNWMPESHYDRYSPNFRKGKPVGTYVVGRDRSKPTTTTKGGKNVSSDSGTKYWTTKDGRKVYTSGGATYDRKTGQRVSGTSSRSNIIKGGHSLDQKTGDMVPHSAASTRRPSSGQQSTRPRQGGTRPVQAQRPTKPTKPAKDTRTTLQKEIDGAKQFIEAHKNKKGAMQNAVKQARESLARLRKKQKGGDVTGKLQIRKANRNIA